MSASSQFAAFIDNTLRAYATSGSFRAALHAESPGSSMKRVAICPPYHKHAETGTCYANHGCRCDACRVGSSRRQKEARIRRAVAEWRRRDMERKAS